MDEVQLQIMSVTLQEKKEKNTANIAVNSPFLYRT